MGILLGTVFVASLLGSLHCVGMCGPFALLASVEREKRKPSVVPTLAYSFGRLITYSIVGAIFGSLGMALNSSTSWSSWQQSATYAAGGLMILVGLIALGRYLGLHLRLPTALSPMQGWLRRGFERTKTMSPVSRALAIGALTSLMPCGWLYTFAIAAAGTGSPVWGTALMVTFWAGTVPIMTALMLGVDRTGVRLRKQLPVIMASLVILTGMFTIAFRAPVAVATEMKVTSDAGQITRQIQEIDHNDLPCCSDQDQTQE